MSCELSSRRRRGWVWCAVRPPPQAPAPTCDNESGERLFRVHSPVLNCVLRSYDLLMYTCLVCCETVTRSARSLMHCRVSSNTVDCVIHVVCHVTRDTQRALATRRGLRVLRGPCAPRVRGGGGFQPDPEQCRGASVPVSCVYCASTVVGST